LFFSDALELRLMFFIRVVRQQALQCMPLLFEQDAASVLSLRREGVPFGLDFLVQAFEPLLDPFLKGLALNLQGGCVQALHPGLQLLECCGDAGPGDLLSQSIACQHAVSVQLLHQGWPLLGAHFGVVLPPCGQGAFQSHIQIAQLPREVPQSLKCLAVALRRLGQQGLV
jgi:hypothetical protein